MTHTEENLFELVQYGLGKSNHIRLHEPVDAKGLFELAQQQGIAAVALDGIN